MSTSVLITDTSNTITVKVLLFGDTCKLTMLAVGGGGTGYGGGGGSGHIQTNTWTTLTEDTNFQVTVGEGAKHERGTAGQSSTVMLNGRLYLGANPGQTAYSGKGANGYCGGGGAGGTGGDGGTDGGNGHCGVTPGGCAEPAGKGSGLKVDSINMKHFVLG